MKSISATLIACVILLASCGAWIGGISFGLMTLFDLAPVAGWTIASLLGFAMAAGVGILLYEISHVIDLTEDVVDPGEFDGLVLPLNWTAQGGFWTTHRPC